MVTPPKEPISSEEAGSRAESAVKTAMLTEEAKFMKKHWKQVAQAYPNLEIPPDNEEKYFLDLAVAASAHPKGSIVAKTKDGGKQVIDLDELDAKLSQHMPGFKARLGGGSLRDQSMSFSEIDETSKAVGDAVRGNTGNIGFLKGASIMNAFSGFMQWLGAIISNFISGGKEKVPSLQDTITRVTADNTRQDITSNLTELSQKSPKMARLLTPERIAEIAGKAHNTILNTRGLGKPETPEVSLRDIRPESPIELKVEDLRAKVREGVNETEIQKLLEAKMTPMLKDALDKAPLFSMATVAKAIKSDEAVNKEIADTSHTVAAKLAPVIKNALVSTTTDAYIKDAKGRALATLPKDEYAALVSDIVSTRAWQVAESHFADKLDKLSDEQKTAMRAGLKQEIQTKVSEKYGDLVIASNAALKQSMPALPEGTIIGQVSGATNVERLPPGPAPTGNANVNTSGRTTG